MQGTSGQPTQAQRFPFDADFQKSLLRLLCDDGHFAHSVESYLEPTYFESEVLNWAWTYCKQFREQYGALPAIQSIKQQVFKIDARLQPLYHAVLEQVSQAPIRDEQFMRDSVLDFIRRNLFVQGFHESRGLYNSGKVEEAYDTMMQRMEKIHATVWKSDDAEWFCADAPQRHVHKMCADYGSSTITTGLEFLDHVLGGGLSKGELGAWIAYAKVGKSTMLVNNGLSAVKLQLAKVAHFVFEGARAQVSDRYEAGFTGELYRTIRETGLSSEAYQRAYQEYQYLKDRLYIRGFTDRWDYSVVDIHDSLKELKRRFGWEPDLIIVDYGDLLTGRDKHYASETEKQKAAWRDLKSLSNRGYAVWTAAQARRPEKGAEDRPHWLYSREIADCYEKVRVCDFLGSLNATNIERSKKVMRILAELYRDNAANVMRVVRADFDRMIIKMDPDVRSDVMPHILSSPKLEVNERAAEAAQVAQTVAQPQQMTARFGS